MPFVTVLSVRIGSCQTSVAVRARNFSTEVAFLSGSGAVGAAVAHYVGMHSIMAKPHYCKNDKELFEFGCKGVTVEHCDGELGPVRNSSSQNDIARQDRSDFSEQTRFGYLIYMNSVVYSSRLHDIYAEFPLVRSYLDVPPTPCRA